MRNKLIAILHFIKKMIPEDNVDKINKYNNTEYSLISYIEVAIL